jgi:hypothetical protein
LTAICLSAIKKVIERGLEQSVLAVAVSVIVIAEFAFWKNIPATVAALIMLLFCFTGRGWLDRYKLHFPIARQVTATTIVLSLTPIIFLLTATIGQLLYRSINPPLPRTPAIFLLPSTKTLPLDQKKASFAQIRASLLDTIKSTLDFDVLPIETVLQNFPAFENVFGHQLPLAELSKDTEQYEAGREVRFLAINDYFVENDKDQWSPFGMRVDLLEPDPKKKHLFRPITDARSFFDVQGYQEHSQLLALIIGYRLMRDIITHANISVNEDTEQTLSQVFSVAFQTAWRGVTRHPGLSKDLTATLEANESCHTFKCLDLLDRGLSDALREMIKSVDPSKARITQEAVLQADGGLH